MTGMTEDQDSLEATLTFREQAGGRNRKARDFLVGQGTFYAACYVADFTASDPAQQRTLQPLLDFLSQAGYLVRKKPVKVIRDNETGERIIKGNVDTEIVLAEQRTLAGSFGRSGRERLAPIRPVPE